MGLQVVQVESKRELDEFLALPERLYCNDPAWVQNLLLLQREVFSESKNPFFEHGEARLFLVLRDGETVGRISGQIDRLHNEHHCERAGFFGFFECANDADAGMALLEAAENFVRGQGMERIRGPLNFSINEELGLLVDGFEHPPMVAMTHALPYYGSLIEHAGFEKCVDLLAYRWDVQRPPERTIAAGEKARAVPGLTLRKVNLWKLRRDVDILLDVFNDAWNDNWGFVPATPREARKLADDLRLIADTNIAIIAEINGEPAGMVVAIPNLYEAIRDFRGHLGPLNAARLLWRLKVRGVQSGRIMLYGVKRKFWTRELVGLPYLLLYELYLGAKKRRYTLAEESWVVDSNARLAALMRYWGAEVYKRYRIYEKAL